jgi:hypothetical protein
MSSATVIRRDFAFLSASYFGGSKPLARQRGAIASDVSAAMKARAAAGSVLLAGIAAA